MNELVFTIQIQSFCEILLICCCFCFEIWTMQNRKGKSQTVFEIRSEKLGQLPIIDFFPVDYGLPHQAFGFEVGPACFKWEFLVARAEQSRADESRWKIYFFEAPSRLHSFPFIWLWNINMEFARFHLATTNASMASCAILLYYSISLHFTVALLSHFKQIYLCSSFSLSLCLLM